MVSDQYSRHDDDYDPGQGDAVILGEDNKTKIEMFDLPMLGGGGGGGAVLTTSTGPKTSSPSRGSPLNNSSRLEGYQAYPY